MTMLSRSNLLLVVALLLACVSGNTAQAATTTTSTAGTTAAPASATHSLNDLQSLVSALGPGTVSPNNAGASGSSSSGLPPILSAATTPTPSPPPRASVNSPTFRLVQSAPCNNSVAQTVMQVYSKNRALFDECVTKGKYQIFPFTGELPTPAQITTQAIVPACTAIFTGVLLSGIPECDISSMALKSVSETLLKITVDIRAGLPCPDSQQFFNLIIWRRDSNMAQSAGLPYDSGSKLYSEYTKNLWKSLTTYNVQVSSDLTISFDNGNSMSGSSAGSRPSVGASKVETPVATTAPSAASADSVKTSTTSGATGSYSNPNAFMSGVVVLGLLSAWV
ncbi:hypothetical protein Gpo141_00013691 [Globisporangium polare]